MEGKLDMGPVEVIERGQIPDCKNCGNYPLCKEYTKCLLLPLEWEGGNVCQE